MATASGAKLGIVTALGTEGARPLDRLAGLPLALRTVLTLQQQGVTRILLVLAPGDAATLPRVRGDRRVRVPVEPAAWDELRSRVDEPFLLAAHDVIAEPAIYRDLRVADLEDAVAVLAVRKGMPLGPLLGTRELLADPEASLDVFRASLASRRIVALDVGDRWCERVDTEEGRRRAFRALFEACRKKQDGMVSRNLNRHISIFVSKQIVDTRITPNMMSVSTFALAVLGALAVARGGYLDMLLGAFLFQWNSILDGVDGELARVRFQHSTFGQWLDTVSDDVSNLVFYAGLAVGSASLPLGPYLVGCAWVAIVAGAIAMALYYAEMARLGSGDLYAIEWGFDKGPQGLGGKLLVFFRNVTKKDFAILFFFGMALCGVLPYALPLIAGGQVATFIAASARNLRRRPA